MNIVIRHIEYLISRNDCVIIPNFGALLANYVKADYDAEASLFMPPHRHFAFNGALSQSDGSLAVSIVNAEGYSYEEACEIVEQEVSAIKAKIQEYKSWPLGRIGLFKYDEVNKAYQFVPFAGNTLSLGFDALPIVRTAEHTPAAAPQHVITPPQITYQPKRHAAPRPSKLSVAVRIAASILLLIGICFMASTPMPIDDAALASLSPEIRPALIEEIIPQPHYPDYLVAYSSNPQGIFTEVSPKSTIQADAKYFLIVASFANREDADRYIIQHNDANLGILEKDGRCRIYAAAFVEQSDAYAYTPIVSQQYEQVWICVR